MNNHVIHVYWEGVRKYLEENSEHIPEGAGVYEILAKKKGKNEYMRRYVGQAADLRTRYSEHLSDEEENEDIYNGVREYVCGFSCALIELKANREDAEQALYDKYRHQWNKERPKGSGRNLTIEIVEHNPDED